MAINPLKAFLFAAGGTVAAAGTAYVSGALDPYLKHTPPAEVAALTPPAGTEAKPAASGTEGRLPAAPAPSAPASGANAMAPAAPASNAMAPAKPSEPATAPAMAPAPTVAGPVVPTFDVVRVESNGSIVVAGNAAANGKVEILNGSMVLGSTVAGSDGAFVIVLDDPLKPGDYTITLRSTTPDKAVIASAQTAVVSVPANASGQVLAMVEEPGKPSELITVPTAEKKPETQAAAAPTAAQPSAEAPAAVAPAASAAAAPVAADAAPAKPAATASATAAAAAAEPKIVVEAVEIDGNKIFIAGLADAGRKVRAYANDILLGDAQTSPDGHFLVEATRDIPVGNYTIHVDGLDADGVKVIARAAVPFEREPGEAVAAVAPAETKPADAKPATVAAAEAPSAPATDAPATQPAAPAVAAAPAPAAETPAPATAPAQAVGAAPAPAEAPAQVAAATPGADVPEIVAPKLEHADGAVIIRRNDTLWRISRRVYGHGVRYSTIYLANQDQIRDPDRIWPGQVFKVPEKSKEGEAANLKAMGDQATTAPTKTE
ncbi:LysM peptidoglycan-binding domain-containing protein [Mesorhizobium sp.]|uniref:LysM peptidoglycan-binding domain-containing protein n=1 Tax=Mesorhizobium sp. TaxID=1871066 RepID=UPI003BACBF21